LKDRTDTVLICTALLFAGLSGLTLTGRFPLPDTWGLMFGIITATELGLLALYRWTLRNERMFVHGYHAGYHDALARPCRFSEADPTCDVYDLSEGRARRLMRSG
jgi:hypothetical protein